MNRALGITYIIISAASFGTLAILGRYARDAGRDTFTLLGGALILIAVIVLTRSELRRTETVAAA